MCALAAGSSSLRESKIAHVLPAPGTFFGDCFTQIRWERIFVKECVSLTIMVMPSQCPQCKHRTSICISQLLWVEEGISGWMGNTGSSSQRLHLCALIKNGGACTPLVSISHFQIKVWTAHNPPPENQWVTVFMEESLVWSVFGYQIKLCSIREGGGFLFVCLGDFFGLSSGLRSFGKAYFCAELFSWISLLRS